MNRRNFLKQAVGLTAVVATAGCLSDQFANAGKSPKKPNILFIYTDDQGFGDMGLQQHLFQVSTPNMDRLAKEGVLFTQGYSSHHCCGPARSGLLSGRYQQRFGVYGNGVGIPTDVKLFGEYFKPMGYSTAMFGKWHQGYAEQFYPTNRGFDEFFGFLGGWHNYYYDPADCNKLTLSQESLKLPSKYRFCDGENRHAKFEGYLTNRLADRCVEFVERNKEKPWAAYMAFNAPHWPLQAPDEVVEKYRDIEATDKRKTTLAMYEILDSEIGRILDTLEKTGQRENTLICFQSDNGGGRYDMDNSTTMYDLTGYKLVFSEGGLRVPTIMSWKGTLPENVVYKNPIMNFDFLPTAVAATGGEMNPDFDGVNLLPYLTRKDSTRPHDEMHWGLFPHEGGSVKVNSWVVRKGDWKLISGYFLNGLFDLSKDPVERNDLSEKYPEKVKELTTLHDKWQSENPKPTYEH